MIEDRSLGTTLNRVFRLTRLSVFIPFTQPVRTIEQADKLGYKLNSKLAPKAAICRLWLNLTAKHGKQAANVTRSKPAGNSSGVSPLPCVIPKQLTALSQRLAAQRCR